MKRKNLKFNYLILLISIFLSGCLDEAIAVRNIELDGYTKVVVKKSGYFGMFRGCTVAKPIFWKIEAVDLNNKKVELLACCGSPLTFSGCNLNGTN